MRSFPAKADQNQAKQDMRRKIIAMLMSWKPEQFGTFRPSGMKYVPDMEKIYTWINKYGHKHPKWLNKYSYQDLVILVSQIEQITKKNKSDGIQKRSGRKKRGDKADIPTPTKGRAQGVKFRSGGAMPKLSPKT